MNQGQTCSFTTAQLTILLVATVVFPTALDLQIPYSPSGPPSAQPKVSDEFVTSVECKTRKEDSGA